MKKTFRFAAILTAVLALTSCTTTTEGTFTIPSDDPYFPGKTAKDSYNAFLATAITGGLNYLKVQDGSSASHFANFVDGLLLQNEFGTLEKQLAESITQTNNYQQFDIKIKSGIPWVTHDGEQYYATINGVSTPQYVSAYDFVNSAKKVLEYGTASELYYLVTNFLEGAMAFYQASYIDYQIANVGGFWSTLANNPTLYAARLNELIFDASGERTNYTASDIEAIRNFERVGVEVIEEPGAQGGGTIRYTLSHPAFYFPTLLTYSPYLPSNEYFINEIGINDFGKDPQSLLYCGPYILRTSNENFVIYEKSDLYWNADEVYVNSINYRIAGMGEGPEFTREMFEQNQVDGFTIDSKDAEGWQKYITGPDGTGTIENPYDPNVNSRTYDYIDYVYGLNLNVARQDRTSYSTSGSLADIENASRAMSIKEVRELLIAGLDLDVYCDQYNADPAYEAQYMINTYVPVGFVQDDNGNDYVESHYYPYYAEQKGITVEEAKEVLAQGQYDGVNASYDDLVSLRENALRAVELYNANPDNTDITFPIQLEYFTTGSVNPEQQAYDNATILAYNRRLNNMPNAQGADFVKSNTSLKFLIVPTDRVNTSNYETVSNGGFFDICTTWGWGPDYGDPMSYLNTFTIDGDWSSIFKFVGEEETVNYYIGEDGTLQSNNLLEEYTALVDAADRIYNNINDRYDEFAKAEYMLINELAIYKPLTMYGQGRQVSVSRASGYHSPSGSYGLANHRLDGLYVLAETITGEERRAAYTKYEQSKADYLAEHGTMNIY